MGVELSLVLGIILYEYGMPTQVLHLVTHYISKKRLAKPNLTRLTGTN
jgi:hypothetical protein